MTPASRPNNKRTAWCAVLIGLALIPLGLAWSAMEATAPGPGGARWAPFLAFVASYALTIVVDVACIGFLWYSAWKGRVGRPALARWTIGVAVVLLVPPLLYLAGGA
ncbi:hypothetical protein [Pseudoduganella chitinolytica]|uniref:DUF2834 domain-containing protein n=1 Tax=Pseudoduganella chitinolytica TaxID=34070 RepID=A0ABY8BLM5_9BURK|nr:hypothetical protein [Pseudoduganella chitinolytica]WEF35796.1 hypothetical protein PX653_13930 [Pseudoduganella chitinolytica]